MKYLSLFILLTIILTSCNNEPFNNREYEAFLLQEYSKESMELDDELNEQIYTKLNLLQMTERSAPLEKILIKMELGEVYFEKAKQVSFQEKKELADSLILILGNYVQGKSTYTVKTSPLNLNSANPKDTSFISNFNVEFDYYFKHNISNTASNILLDKLKRDFKSFLNDRVYVVWPTSGPLHAIIAEHTQIYKQHSEAYITSAYGVYDLSQKTPIKFHGKEINTGFYIKLPDKSGRHVINGEYGYVQAGEMTWKPFEIEFLLD
ncbi:hypothetical protein K6119_13085 [Paracrocinitomix mangrovi]|uniref:hypothetical protein n=1 Tax=Paracrocinitomix mangrovi TaxID=2862509 RepID=UPI001C8E4C3F|nr:hypothetical protein [Paracrocinitomix mangrovi]UKN00664.1 hypothetical protein K6119_13085 [Paracrocinitomix mangrovi]